MRKCDRRSFILISQGILLDRNEKGEVKIGDTQEAHEAWEAHQKGEPIHLTPQDTVIQNGIERYPTEKDILEMAPKIPAYLREN